jgi:hypothetical protein
MPPLLPLRARVIARVLIVAVGIGSVCWAAFILPRFWSEAGILRIVEHILDGEIYKPDVLDSVLVKLQGRTALLRPSILSKLVMIDLVRAQDAIGSGQSDIIDSRLNVLRQRLDEALMSTPSDAFLWFVVFWVDSARNGFAPEYLAYLRFSYEFAHNEGWIATIRNPLALAIYPALPSDLADAATSEFVGLVRSKLYEVAADHLAGPGWPIRNLLLTSLRDLSEEDRRAFAVVLNRRGLEDVSVPGIDLTQPARPWQH